MSDPHIRLNYEEARKQGCICEYGCRNCDEHLSRMGNCPAWDPCPVGRKQDNNCPLLEKNDGMDNK